MYNVNVAGRTAASESSYEKAVTAAKASIPAVSAAINAKADAIRTNARLYRSPKARRNAVNALLLQANKAIENIKFPKKSGNVDLNIAGINLSILKA